MDLSSLMSNAALVNLVGGAIVTAGGWFGARWVERRAAIRKIEDLRIENAQRLEEIRLQADIAARARIPDMQETLNAGVREIVTHYREALDKSAHENAQFRVELTKLSDLVIAQTRRLAEQSDFLTEQSELIKDLENDITRLVQAMKEKGIQVPELVKHVHRKRLSSPQFAFPEAAASS